MQCHVAPLLGSFSMKYVARTVVWFDRKSSKSVAREPNKHTDLAEAMKSYTSGYGHGAAESPRVLQGDT